MRIISKAGDELYKLWGNARIKDAAYREMRYVLREEVEDGTLLHNCVTGELILIDGDELRALDALPGMPAEVLKPLIADRFIVPVDYDEHRAVLQLRIAMQTMHAPKEITGYTILPTTHCNARCFYCYESDIEHKNMSAETAHKLVEFIAAHRGDKEIHLSWFGGEPLVGVKRIDQICAELREREISYTSDMITNGYLFDADLVRRAKEEWKLQSMQITLDGTEEVYNRVKAYVSVEGSPYRRVLDNIGLLLDAEIAVSIRLNMDRHNHEDLKALIVELAERFGGRKGFSANVAALFDDCGFTPVRHDSEDKKALESWQKEIQALLEEKKLARIQFELPSLRYRFCLADNSNCLIVAPDGSLQKCEHHIESSCVGSIEDGVTNTDEMTRWQTPLEMDICDNCPLLPYCYHIRDCEGQNHCTEWERSKKLENAHIAMNNCFERESTPETDVSHNEQDQ